MRQPLIENSAPIDLAAKMTIHQPPPLRLHLIVGREDCWLEFKEGIEPPGYWYRFWGRLLLGWRWEKVDEG